MTDLNSSAGNTNETLKVYHVFIIKNHGTTICLHNKGGCNESAWVTEIKSNIIRGEKKNLIGLIAKLLNVGKRFWLFPKASLMMNLKRHKRRG